MYYRALPIGTMAMLVFLSACAVGEPDAPDQDSELESELAVSLHQPKPGDYDHKNASDGFPLGSCGNQGTTELRDSQLNDHNSPYTLEWTSDSCVTIHDNPENCRYARSVEECEGWRTKERKIAFPLDWKGADSCLTKGLAAAAYKDRATPEIGTVTLIDPKHPSSRTNVGVLKIYRLDGSSGNPRYQYEMEAYGGAGSSFTQVAHRSSLDGMRMCVTSYRTGREPPAGRSLQSCAHFTTDERAAYSFYDANTHAYCPVGIAPATKP